VMRQLENFEKRIDIKDGKSSTRPARQRRMPAGSS
jgi:hypothetical protein